MRWTLLAKFPTYAERLRCWNSRVFLLFDFLLITSTCLSFQRKSSDFAVPLNEAEIAAVLPRQTCLTRPLSGFAHFTPMLPPQYLSLKGTKPAFPFLCSLLCCCYRSINRSFELRPKYVLLKSLTHPPASREPLKRSPQKGPRQDVVPTST